MSFLASLPREKHVKVICVAGPYRSGKSFLLNRIVGQMKGFEVGKTVQSCTQGIWIWNEPLIDSSDENEDLTLLVDTEGLFSADRETDTDLRLFALSVLLSSTLIFNQMGPINEQTLNDLQFIVNLAQYLGESSQRSLEAPDLCWVLRDFYHDISEFENDDAYMESCLRPDLDSVKGNALKKNTVRKTITGFF